MNKNTDDWLNIHLRVVLEYPHSAGPPKLDFKIFSLVLTLSESMALTLTRAYALPTAAAIRKWALTMIRNISLDHK